MKIPAKLHILIPLTATLYALQIIILGYFFPNFVIPISTMIAVFYLADILGTIIRADLNHFVGFVLQFAWVSLGIAIGTAVFAPTVALGFKIGLLLFFSYFLVFALTLFLGFVIRKEKFRKNFEETTKNSPYIFEA